VKTQFSKELQTILGPTYGGPSISFEDGKFVLYTWTDAPVGMEILISGTSIPDLVRKCKKAKIK